MTLLRGSIVYVGKVRVSSQYKSNNEALSQEYPNAAQCYHGYAPGQETKPQEESHNG